MGLGKTFTGAEKIIQFGNKVNLIICQKSKVEDWNMHFLTYYGGPKSLNKNICINWDLTDNQDFENFFNAINDPDWEVSHVGIINYDLVFRRKKLLQLENFTLLLDESSLIQNEQTKRSKFILKMKPKNVILLSGTPTGGKYEKLWSQLYLLGWKISKSMYYHTYVNFHYDTSAGFPLMIIDGYKNQDRLKRKMKEHGCHFLKTEEVFDLPNQVHQVIQIPTIKQYTKFKKDKIIKIQNKELVGDTTLIKMLYERQLCGQYNQNKLDAFKDLLESTDGRLIVFYNYNAELEILQKTVNDLQRAFSIINGKEKQLIAYERIDNSVTLIQYQAGAMGLNLQKANKIVYFTPPLSSELFEQSKKRIHRIGQSNSCFYYYLICKNSIEEKIYKTLKKRRNYTNELFKKDN